MAVARGLKGAPAPFDKGGVKVALISLVSSGDFFQAYRSGVKAQARSLGIKLKILDARNDPAIQGDLMEQAINKKYDGIIIDHGLTEVLSPLVDKAIKAGIEVVVFDVDVSNPKAIQIEQSDHALARLVLEQAVKDNGVKFSAGYVYVPGFAPTDRRDEVWREFKKTYRGINEKARFGAISDTTATTVADQAAAVFRANPDISVVFAPYDEYAKGVKLAVDEAGINNRVRIYSADISTTDIRLMKEKDSPWVATAATNPVVVGRVSVRAVALLIAGERPSKKLVVLPALVTQEQLRTSGINNMRTLAKKIFSFGKAKIANPNWIPIPKR